MKIALVTGANKGLGFETSKQLAQKGHKVYMGCRNDERGEAAAKHLKSMQLDVEFIKLDVNNRSDIRSFMDKIKSRDEKLDLLVNNAGVFLESSGPQDKSSSSVLKVDPVIILKTIETNAMGPLTLIQSIVPHMIENDYGRIINISSGMGQLENMNGHWPGYRMSKCSLNALTKILSDEVADHNIYINSVCPGWVRTDMGGNSASLSVEQGVESIVWLATCDDSPKGKFISNKKEINW